MIFKTSTLIASLIALPLLTHGISIIGYNEILIQVFGTVDPVMDATIRFYSFKEERECHSRIGGPGLTTEDRGNPFISGGGRYTRRLLPQVIAPPLGDYRAGGAGLGYIGGYVPSSGGRGWRRRLRRAEDESAEGQSPEGPPAPQCPADNNECAEMVFPTIYAYPDDKSVWVLDPLSKDKQGNFTVEVSKAEKSMVDIVKEYGANFFEDKTQEPGLKAIAEAEAKVDTAAQPAPGGDGGQPAPADGGGEPSPAGDGQ
ncbi:MAG: hypothetical protein Q9210_006836 [Variospora velana]